MATPTRAAPQAPARAPAPAPARAPAPRAGASGRGGRGSPAARATPAASTLLPAGAAAAPAAAEQVGAKLAEGEVDLSKGNLALDPRVTESVKEGGEVDVRVRLPGLAQGEIRLRRRQDRFSTVRDQGIRFAHPALARFNAANPTVLVLKVSDDVVTGWVGLGLPGPPRGSQRAVFEAMTKASQTLGWLGISAIQVPAVTNKFADGQLEVKADKFGFTVGGFLGATGSAVLDNKALSFDGSARIQIPGGTTGELQIAKNPAGMLAGKLDLAVNIGSVAGNVTATLTDGFVSILGSVAYNGDRMSGKVTLVATDEATARDITLKKPEAGADVPIELPGPDKPVKPGKRAFCGWGQLTFRVTDWLAGTATVIVNSKGQATVVGEIAPPKEFILFPQKEWVKRLLKVEIRAGYGIPVVGQVGLFASIALEAVAAVGPGKLYQIKLTGAYSTDPRVTKQLAIEGTLNISAFAGLRLRAEAGLVVTILAHDVKAGVSLNAIAGVRGYVEARPRIGMRELQPGKRQYYIQGHLEIAAQPILGFSGDLFVAIETPWWSPLSDKRWTWPLFAIEYPLPGEFGIGADVDYVLGSKQWPSIEFGEVDFDSSKFLTDVMNDNADSGKGGEQKKQGDWKEGKGGGGPGGAKNKGGKGKKPGEPGYDSEPVGEQLSFSDGKESHKLWFAEKPGDATLMVASAEQKLDAAMKKVDEKIELLMKEDRPRARALKQKILALLPSVETTADQVAIMKEAERKAEDMYRKHGKKKGKSKGKKEDRKTKNKKLKAEQRKVKEMLVGLYAMVLTVPFEKVDRSPAMHDGTESLSIVKEQDHPNLHISKRKSDEIFATIVGSGAPLVTKAVGSAGLTRAKKAQSDILAQVTKIKAIPVKGNEINAKNLKALEPIADKSAGIVSSFGTAMQIARLKRAHEFLPVKLGAQGIIKFKADPAKVGTGLYRRQFLKNMREQLRDQEQGIRKESVAQWLAERAKFTMDSKAFRALDTEGRKEVMTELKDRAKRAHKTALDTQAKLLKWIEETDSKAKQSDKDLQQLQIWALQLDRAGEREDAAKAAIREIVRVSRAHASGKFAIPDADILKADYQGTTERIRNRIVGRQNQEKAVRDKHKDNLKAFLKRQKDWSLLAKTGSDLAILHRPDQVAGGFDAFEKLEVPPGKVDDNDPDWIAYFKALRKMFGPAKVNSLIGTQWKGQIEELATHLRKTLPAKMSHPIYQMNLSLRIVPRDT